MQKKFGLKQKMINEINTIFSRYPSVQKTIIYGSRAKGNYKAGSDIDLTLVGTRITHRDISRILNDLDNSYIPYSFDLSIFSQLQRANLINHIKRVGKIFYQRTEQPI